MKSTQSACSLTWACLAFLYHPLANVNGESMWVRNSKKMKNQVILRTKPSSKRNQSQTHRWLNCSMRRRSKIFSSGSQVLCLKRQERWVKPFVQSVIIMKRMEYGMSCETACLSSSPKNGNKSSIQRENSKIYTHFSLHPFHFTKYSVFPWKRKDMLL